MKICLQCKNLFQEMAMSCPTCQKDLKEVSLSEVLALTEEKAFHGHISGIAESDLSDSNVQYHLRSYLRNRSLFLDFDLYKNRLKHGQRLKRFFIAPVNVTVIINLPWFLFNVVSSNLFHTQYTEYCARCDSKYIKGRHTLEECDYNIEFFHILDDILNGKILDRKMIYKENAKERVAKGLRSAYVDLFCRSIPWESFWDLISIGLSIAFWLYVAVYISWPMFQVLLQQLAHLDSYELIIGFR